MLWSYATMSHASILLSVAVLWTFAVIVPGPNFLLTARLSITRSRRDGLRAVAGIGIGTLFWSAAGCFGIQALFAAAPWMYATLKLLGGAWLVYLGLQLLWRSRRGDRRNDGGLVRAGTKASAFRLGLLTTVTNPKSAVFVASIFATTMPGHPAFGLIVAVMTTMITISIGWYCFVVCLLTTKRLSGVYLRSRRWIDRVAGACFILFGARLMAER